MDERGEGAWIEAGIRVGVGPVRVGIGCGVDEVRVRRGEVIECGLVFEIVREFVGEVGGGRGDL